MEMAVRKWALAHSFRLKSLQRNRNRTNSYV